jgi:methyl-accepting chemotaxis protein
MLHPPVDPNVEPIPTVMVGSTRSSANPDAGVFDRFLGRRRNYLVDSAYQVKTAIVAVLGMVFLLAFAAVLFHLVGMENALMQKGAPGRTGDARSVLYLVAAGIIFVAAVFVIEILETHKTAGVVLKVARGLKDIEQGVFGAHVMLRRNDNFKELEEGFNVVARSLRDRVEDDLNALQNLEGQLRLLSREVEGGNREGSLVLLRQVLGELQTLRERKRNLLRAPVRPVADPRI